jgi:hypothetical protein
MSKTRMAGEALSQEERNKRARDRIAENDDLRAARLGGIQYGDGLKSIEGLDEKAVARAYQGDSWGNDDLRRYNDIMGISNGGGEDNAPVVDTPPTVEPPAAHVDPPVTSPTKPPANGIITSPGLYNQFGGSTQNVVQDNDVNITGDNNTVTQDNSVSHYGDSIRSGRSFLDAFMSSKGLK